MLTGQRRSQIQAAETRKRGDLAVCSNSAAPRLRGSLRWMASQRYIPLYCGPPPPSGGTQVITAYGSMMSHVLQWTQFDALICRRGVPSVSWVISYTLAGQKRMHGCPYSGPQMELQTSVCTRRCDG